MADRLTGFTDGGVRVSNPGVAACAFVLLKNGEEIYKGGRFIGNKVTNNEAEYKGLLGLLEYIKQQKLRNVFIHSDSQLMVRQVKGEYSSDKALTGFKVYASVLLSETGSHLEWVPRERNTVADAEVNRILDEVQKENPAK